MTADAPAERAWPAIRKERDRFAALSFCWADAVVELDPQGRIVYCAGACETLFAATADALAGADLAQFVAPDHKNTLDTLIGTRPGRGRVAAPEIKLIGVDGREKVVALCGFRLDELDGHAFVALRSRGLAGSGPADAADAAARDAASGLYSADAFAELVSERIQSDAARACEVSLIFLPGYESLHRRLGEAGERELAAAVGDCLRAAAIDGRSAGRIGPDRYSLLHDPSLDLRALENRMTALTRQKDPTAAGCGVQSATLTLDPAGTGAASSSQAEIASALLYTLNRFRSSKGAAFTLKSMSGSITALAREAFDAVTAFKTATRFSEFQVLFQPIVDARTGIIHHYEALARFPTICGMHSPFEQITFAEETGLIADFDLAMTKKVIDWLAAGRALNGTTRVAVNVSGQSLGSVACLTALDALLRANAWTRGRLMFEITESAHLGNLVAANAFIQRLRRQGFPVCLDDFGAGAANFEYLSSLEIDIVKLDGSAVRGAQKAHKGRAFLKALVGLCRELGVVTVAEMIEDEAALNFVRGCGVHYVQGYLFGRPARDISAFRNAVPVRLFSSGAMAEGGRRQSLASARSA